MKQNSFLSTHRVYDDAAFTHTSTDKAKFNVNRQSMDTVLDSYCDSAMLGELLQYTEKPQIYSQLRIDVDVKRPGEFPARFYSEAQLMHIVKCFQEIISKNIYNSNESHEICFVLEKPPYKISENGKTYIKNGFHYQFPNVFVSKNALKNTIFPKVGKLMDKSPEVYVDLINEGDKPSSLLDVKACCSAMWLMYGGSKNVKTGKYTLTKIITHDGHNIPLSDFLEEYKLYDKDGGLIDTTQKEPEYYIPRILSINTYGRLSQDVRNNVLDVIESCQQQTKPIGFTLDDDGILSQDQINKNVIMASTLCNMLQEFRSDDRHEWCKIGWILHNISGGTQPGLDLFINFSQRSPRWGETFGEEGCATHWNGVQYSYGMGTLKFLAKLDDPEEYDNFVKKTAKTTLSIKGKKKLSHWDFAVILKTMVGQENVFSSNKWYNFTGQKWKVLEKGLYLSKMISLELRQQYEIVLEDCRKAILDSDDTARAAKDYEKMNDIVEKLGDSNYKRGIMSACSELFWYDDFFGKLNKIPHIFIFQNGTMDFSLTGKDGDPGVFRDTVPDDFSSRCAAVDYEEFNEDHPDMIALRLYLSQVFPDESVREFFLESMSDIMIKGNTYKYVLFWTGNGNNSKSIIQSIFEKMMGDYCKKLPTAAIIGKRGNCGPAPELARIGNDVRGIWAQEPSGTDSIDTGLLKEFSGNDTMYARTLFSEGGEMSLDFITIITCNTPPIIRGDKAVWNRIKMIPFEAEFTTDAPIDVEEQIRQKKFPMDINFMKKLDRYLKPMAYLLVQYKRRLINSYITIPDKVSHATNIYKMKNNVVLLFTNDYLIVDPAGAIDVMDVYQTFKGWYRSAYPSSSDIPTPADFKESICSQIKIKVPEDVQILGIRMKNKLDREKAREEKENAENALNSPSAPKHIDVRYGTSFDKGVEETKSEKRVNNPRRGCCPDIGDDTLEKKHNKMRMKKRQQLNIPKDIVIEDDDQTSDHENRFVEAETEFQRGTEFQRIEKEHEEAMALRIIADGGNPEDIIYPEDLKPRKRLLRQVKKKLLL